MHISHLKNLALLLCALCWNGFGATDDSQPGTPVSVSVNGPAYTFPYQNPLYGTVAGYLKVSHVQIPGERLLKLDVPGFAESVPVHAVLQEGCSQLAVVLLGIGGRADAD